MDPNLFHMDYERLFEVLVTIVVFSFLIERALAPIFESRWFISFYEGNGKRKGFKELIAFAVSIVACVVWKLDALTIITASHETMQFYGYVLTGAVVAGGSKASIKLFKDVMGFMSSAERERVEKKNKKKKP